MKSPIRSLSILTRVVASLAVFGTAVVHGEPSFEKDAQVRLTKDAPVYFQDKVVRQGKEGETFKVITYNPAKKRVFVLSTDAEGKPIALNLEDDALAVVSPPAPGAGSVTSGTPSTPAKPRKRSANQQAPDEFLQLVETSPDASKETVLNKGAVYNITGKFAPFFQIVQIADGLILVADASSRSPELVAVLVPENERVLESVNIGTFGNGSPYGYTARAVGKFVSFKDIPLASGASKRLPVFLISGLNFYDGKFINMAGEK